MYKEVLALSDELRVIGEELLTHVFSLTLGELTDDEAFILTDLLEVEEEINLAISELDSQREEDISHEYLQQVYSMLIRQKKILQTALHLFKKRAEAMRCDN